MGMIEINQCFWNIRGSFKIGGLVDIGTQCSLVKLKDGSFVFLDACNLAPDVAAEVDALTDGGKKIKAILNLHPFHTVYVKKLHERYPEALLYGTARHHELLPELPWQALCTEDPELHQLFADDLAFSVPKGVDFISANDKIHFSSVLVFHPASKTIHVDDTLMFSELPGPMRLIGVKGVLSFHPTLILALQKRTGTADEFEIWVEQLAEDWAEAENLCAAHTAPLLASDNAGARIDKRIRNALTLVKWLLAAHRLKYR